ncbi:MAG TPA: PEGA domain-containing protein [Myxococcota bacterium]|nr:PEGA domain-containing protein [Myxococcota bacterium]
MRKAIKISALLTGMLLLALPARPARAQALASFAFGRGKAAAGQAIDVQRSLRELVDNTGSYKGVDLQALLGAGSAAAARLESIDEGKRLLTNGKGAYEQLDLELAQKSFMTALRKFEYGYGFMDKPGPLLECLMYLGATWVLVGEPDRAISVFQRAYDLPGRKVLDPNLFPPNIQEIFKSAAKQAASGTMGKVTLLSVPQNAEIYVDGEYRGGSPLKAVDLRAGAHMVKAVKDGYLPWGGHIKAVAGKKRTLRLKLQPSVRHKTFAQRFMRLVAEIMKGDPAEASSEMAGFLKTERLALVALSGSPAAMTFKGYLCDTSGAKLQSAHLEKMLDTTSPGYPDELKSFLQSLLAARPGAEPEPVAEGAEGAEEEGAAAAAALLAGGGKEGAAEGGAEGFGIDLSEGKPAVEEKVEHPPEEETEKAIAATETPEKTAEKTIEETKPQEKKEAVQLAAVWYKQWWFWTAVGAVVAGAAATGTYFLVSGGDSSTGGLVLDMH